MDPTHKLIVIKGYHDASCRCSNSIGSIKTSKDSLHLVGWNRISKNRSWYPFVAAPRRRYRNQQFWRNGRPDRSSIIAARKFYWFARSLRILPFLWSIKITADTKCSSNTIGDGGWTNVIALSWRCFDCEIASIRSTSLVQRDDRRPSRSLHLTRSTIKKSKRTHVWHWRW